MSFLDLNIDVKLIIAKHFSNDNAIHKNFMTTPDDDLQKKLFDEVEEIYMSLGTYLYIWPASCDYNFFFCPTVIADLLVCVCVYLCVCALTKTCSPTVNADLRCFLRVVLAPDPMSLPPSWRLPVHESGSSDVSPKKKLSPKTLMQKAFSFGRSPSDPDSARQRLEQEKQRQDSELQTRAKEAASILLRQGRHKLTKPEPVP